MKSHPTFPLKVEDSQSQLILMPCPGTKDADLMDSLKQLKESGVSAIVTLMTKEELEELAFSQMGKSIKSLGVSWFHLPIADGSCPDPLFNEAWETAGPAIHRLLEKQKNIAIHCKGGSGRTGLVAGKILLERGEALNKVIKRIQQLRPNAFQSASQCEYLESVESELTHK